MDGKWLLELEKEGVYLGLHCRLMPTVHRQNGYQFFFYSNENNEPPHIHVEYGDDECKYWLQPISMAANYGMNGRQLRDIERIVFENQHLFIQKYNDHLSRN